MKLTTPSLDSADDWIFPSLKKVLLDAAALEISKASFGPLAASVNIEVLPLILPGGGF